MSKKSKMGRPKLPKGEAKGVFSLRLSSEEREAIDAAAKRAEKKPTEWARNAIITAAKRA
ncbi:MAG: hypothetical protein HYV95_08425 [Opitutae bacterium]|nr:hypothetical protein [Opitutae bacterium]